MVEKNLKLLQVPIPIILIQLVYDFQELIYENGFIIILDHCYVNALNDRYVIIK